MDKRVEVLNECRALIDEVDQQLISCLAKRFQLSKAIGSIKRDADVRVHQPDRAKQVEEHYVNLGTSHGIQRNFAVDLFHLIHEESCRIQRVEE
ncbi:chorismate mutase [Alicyclobacillus fastidiosus]|uniref:Chorismate mutase n=1 Tax=Alicyclobacillus fastidiosus TaxID=392011 RepID=A0ABV5A9U4_9BACL|nr:chorismate mutase [Alicyclobacillus fastidiosus]WEH10897.1 chorismate mutase [Alicyclobacillus fastidiosus]